MRRAFSSSTRSCCSGGGHWRRRQALLLPTRRYSSSSRRNVVGASLSLSPPPMTAAVETSAAIGGDVEFGFGRAEMGKVDLIGTMDGDFDRHLFLRYKSPGDWSSHLESADHLPQILSAAIKARKADFKKKTRLTICEAEDGSDSSQGEVFIFPDMIKYCGLMHSDVDSFVEEVLVKDAKWQSGAIEALTGSYVFICAHGSRDKRCGVCGPILITKFKEEINARGLDDQISVSACSHVGGHKYAGNAIIFSPNNDGEIASHWYGYVTPDDVSTLIEQHIGKGQVVEHLWRGQMGLSKEGQKQAQQLRRQAVESAPVDRSVSGCCQGAAGSFTCCQSTGNPENGADNHAKTTEQKGSSSSEAGGCCGRFCASWFKNWECEDTYAAAAVVSAVAAVAVAYSCYKYKHMS